MRPYLMLLLALITLSACTTSPTGRRQLQLFSSQQMNQMGALSFQQIKKQTPKNRNRKQNQMVSCVARAITNNLPNPGDRNGWEVEVFDQDQVNAFAVPGKKIGVNTGLLAVTENQHQLAAVIGHEVAHVLARHANERMSTAFATQAGLNVAAVMAGSRKDPKKAHMMGLLGLGAQVGILLPFGRTQESESDIIGLELMARGGFDPRQSVKLWQNMAKEGGAARPPEFLSTHPSGQTRIHKLNNHMPKAMALYEQAQAIGNKPKCD